MVDNVFEYNMPKENQLFCHKLTLSGLSDKFFPLQEVYDGLNVFIMISFSVVVYNYIVKIECHTLKSQ